MICCSILIPGKCCGSKSCAHSVVFHVAFLDRLLLSLCKMEEQPGPSGLNIHATVSLAVHVTGNGSSTYGSNEPTPMIPRKRKRRPETWKHTVEN